MGHKEVSDTHRHTHHVSARGWEAWWAEPPHAADQRTPPRRASPPPQPCDCVPLHDERDSPGGIKNCKSVQRYRGRGGGWLNHKCPCETEGDVSDHRSRGSRPELEGAVHPALRMEEGGTGQGSGGKRGKRISPWASRRNRPCHCLGSSPVRLISLNCKRITVLVKATKFGELDYSSHGKPATPDPHIRAEGGASPAKLPSTRGPV